MLRLLLLLLTLGVSGGYSDSHTYRYFYTGVSDTGGGLPLYTVVGYVDEFQIGIYTSDTREFQPRTEWIKKAADPDLWKINTQIFKGTEAVFKHDVQTAMQRFNQTGGIHIVQYMYGCELRGDGSSRGYNQYGYDGKEFLSLDTERWTYVSTAPEAQITAQRWNSAEVNEAQRRRNYLENICIPWLQKYITYGREELGRRVRPEVAVTSRQSDSATMLHLRPEVAVTSRQTDSATMLHCKVYGFYPRDVDVKWVRNGKDDVISHEAKQILPHPDGSYQIRVTVEVPAREGDSYSCHVDHSSLEEPLLVLWEPKNSDTIPPYIIIAVVGVLVVIAAGVGFYVCKKRSGNKMPGACYYPAAKSDNSPASPTACA
ncbi:class I histocompatibility antigen, F10 alpha chain-like isoform X2 [Ascaphus truei]|uniref:class I histocompatibility antigen, F10 alpha chain-like isoform X2 n=1 Tax=Ascaphus truei TaxID=8439 RepID=UPI003F5A10B5